MAFDFIRQVQERARQFLGDGEDIGGGGPDMSLLTSALSSLKTTALAMAAQNHSYPDNPATMSDYVTASENISTLMQRDPATLSPLQVQARGYLQTLTAEGASVDQVWNSKIWSDLSGQKISNMLVRSEDLEKVDGGNSWRFNDTIWDHTTFRPMKSYDPDRAVSATFNDVTFDGMEEGDPATRLAKATYKDVKVVNAHGGAMIVDDNVHVDGMNISGQRMALHIGTRSSINNLNATDAHLIELTAGGASRITNPVFKNTIMYTPPGGLGGSIWQGDTNPDTFAFDSVSLNHCDFNHTTLNNIRIRNSDVNGLDVSGATITNMIVNGKPIRSLQDLENIRDEHGQSMIKTDATTRIAFNAEGQQIYTHQTVREQGRKLASAVQQAIALPAEQPAEQQQQQQQAVVAPVAGVGGAAPIDPSLAGSPQWQASRARAMAANTMNRTVTADDDAHTVAMRKAKAAMKTAGISGGHDADHTQVKSQSFVADNAAGLEALDHGHRLHLPLDPEASQRKVHAEKSEIRDAKNVHEASGPTALSGEAAKHAQEFAAKKAELAAAQTTRHLT